MEPVNVGIRGIGVFAPEKVRRNGDWPSAVLERIRNRAEQDLMNPKVGAEGLSGLPPSARIALEEIAKFESDPFHGCVERRVIADGETTTAMEVRAARLAIEKAGIDPALIGLVVGQSMLPDTISSAVNASTVHGELGLRRDCMVVEVNSICSSFLAQVILASRYIQSGATGVALLVQSTAFSRVCDYSSSLSFTFGDGASAVVLTRVAPAHGILGESYFNDSAYKRVATISRPSGSPWYVADPDRHLVGSMDFDRAKSLTPLLPGLADQAIEKALQSSGLKREDVDFFTAHQPNAWFVPACKRAAGLQRARSVDTFKSFASMGAANIPFNLYAAAQEGQLRDGDIVALFSTGGGFNWGAMILRWGR